jgi:hypothetical protein
VIHLKIHIALLSMHHQVRIVFGAPHHLKKIPPERQTMIIMQEATF